MAIEVSEKIRAPRDKVWQIITDSDHWAERISGIESIEVLERPSTGVVGLKWKETRKMFGKEAVETMWISAAEAPNWYQATAHNHGAIYTSRLEISDDPDGSILTMSFNAEATTFGARIMSMLSFLFNSSLRKMLQKDLQDIREAAERY